MDGQEKRHVLIKQFNQNYCFEDNSFDNYIIVLSNKNKIPQMDVGKIYDNSKDNNEDFQLECEDSDSVNERLSRISNHHYLEN
jgi:hypothetical protein